MTVRSTVRNIPTPKIRLNVPVSGPPLTMEMGQFFEFSFWLAEELLDLEAKFAVRKSPTTEPPPVFDANGLPEDLEIDFF